MKLGVSITTRKQLPPGLSIFTGQSLSEVTSQVVTKSVITAKDAQVTQHKSLLSLLLLGFIVLVATGWISVNMNDHFLEMPILIPTTIGITHYRHDRLCRHRRFELILSC